MISSDIEMMEPCSNRPAVTHLLDRVTAQLSMQLLLLCTDSLVCEVVLHHQNCEQHLRSSVIGVQYELLIHQEKVTENVSAVQVRHVMSSARLFCSLGGRSALT